MDSSSTHPKMLVVPARLNLRRSAFNRDLDRGPVSSTSSRFNFNHLLFSPPPSPSLPALVPRPKKSPAKILVTRPSRILRRLVAVLGLLSALYVVVLALQNRGAMPAVWPYFAHEEFVMVGQDALPDFPTPIVTSDSRGRSKWTVSIPHDSGFPLAMDQYADMSVQCRESSARARDLHHKAPVTEQAMLSYDAPDENFIDIAEAESAGMLPAPSKLLFRREPGHLVGIDERRMASKPFCKSSLTYVLESPDAGMGNALMMLWTFYGLAKDQGRAFFIDDSRWAYGDYTQIFEPPVVPDCRPPPRHQMVPCPFQARHLVVSAVTAKDIFPALLSKNHRVSRSDKGVRDLYELARKGYEDLFSLTKEDQQYVDTRVTGLAAKANARSAGATKRPIIGLHIRHGDQHPYEYQYRDTYIPTEVFLKNLEELEEEHYRSAIDRDATEHRAITVIASDDPSVHEEPDFAGVVLAQQRIRLASKIAIEEANPNPQELRQFVDEAFGWEGGFFAPMFWNLGVERRNNAANAPEGVVVENVNEEARHMATPSEQTLRLRSFVGRAYMMDLAVVAGASDKVVCAVSAMGCRLLAVMMGWDDAMTKGSWVNVDGPYEWTGIDW